MKRLVAASFAVAAIVLAGASPTPRPTPVVVGETPAPSRGVVVVGRTPSPAFTLPPTDSEARP